MGIDMAGLQVAQRLKHAVQAVLADDLRQRPLALAQGGRQGGQHPLARVVGGFGHGGFQVGPGRWRGWRRGKAPQQVGNRQLRYPGAVTGE